MLIFKNVKKFMRDCDLLFGGKNFLVFFVCLLLVED